MTSDAEGLLFEAVSTPQRSYSHRAFAFLAMLALALGLAGGIVFAMLGAWPVTGFLGGEFALVLGLVWMHQRWSARAFEIIALKEGHLSVTRSDGRGRWVSVVIDPYWARLQHDRIPGRAGILTLATRNRRVEIGRYLNAEEKRSLEEALRDALRRYREPRFDNPQLREG
ncbi:DUF2244 domain-containing protein [Acetobacteraceae bacterium H6797]|nr:DUF2244 domain-containing protein [Acetobacteraceae bacterium H6797]